MKTSDMHTYLQNRYDMTETNKQTHQFLAFESQKQYSFEHNGLDNSWGN